MSISAHGGGLVNGIAGMENKFTVFTSGKPVSGLTVAFEGISSGYFCALFTNDFSMIKVQRNLR